MGRLLSIKNETESLTYAITNVYAPIIPRKKKKIFQTLEKYKPNNTNNTLGGFNMVENIPKDRAGGNIA